MFVNLLTHSYFSLLMSSISIDDIIHYAIANKQKYVCLTDFNNMYGAMEFYNKAHQNNLIPIIGLHIVFNNQDVYLIAKDNKGYKNLLKISSNVMTNQSFNIKNYIDSLFVIADDIDKISWLKQKENGFSLNQSKTNPIAARPCFYENKEDVIYVNALNAIANEKKLEDYDNDKQLNDLYLLNEDSAKKIFSKQALDNLAKVIKSSSWDLELNKKHYMIKYQQGKQSNILLQTMCLEALTKLFGNKDKIPKEYLYRLKYEVQLVVSLHIY